MPEHIRIAVIDDHPLLLVGLTAALRRREGIEIVGEGATANEAIRIARQKRPDIMVLDIGIPGGGIEAQRVILSSCPGVKTIILTGSAAEELVIAALEAGARAYVLKETTGPELERAIAAVQHGETYVTPSLAARLLQGSRRRTLEKPAHQSVEHGLDALTHREEEILDHACRGLTNKEIARSVNVSEKTVKHYMTTIFEKLHVRNRVEAVLRRRRITS